jgi:hypothetical protein
MTNPHCQIRSKWRRLPYSVPERSLISYHSGFDIDVFERSALQIFAKSAAAFAHDIKFGDPSFNLLLLPSSFQSGIPFGANILSQYQFIQGLSAAILSLPTECDMPASVLIERSLFVEGNLPVVCGGRGI